MNTEQSVNQIKKLVMCAIVFATVASCTWVKETDSGSAVAVLTEDALVDCKYIGTAKSKVKDSVGFVNRSKEKVQRELATLAKNEAATMGGNAIVAQPVVEYGEQQFKVYACSSER